jgi:parallel beta-helix repeat protein
MAILWKRVGPALFLALLTGLIALVLGGMLARVPADTLPQPDRFGAGASSVEPSYSGLQREFPPLNRPTGEADTAEQIALGRLLFYDPVLSAGDDLSCASCHHPDFGFADGLATAQGAGASGHGPARSGGASLTRNTPSLWNVGTVTALFWDGRAASLEAQAVVPLTAPDEMGATPEQIVTDLQAIPDYRQLFARAYADGVTFDNTAHALAAFERSLVSRNSPFDRYAAGQVDALTAQQRRGLTLFRSAATRCFECHSAPTFGTDTFFVTGIEGDDPGRAGVSADGQEGAFRAVSLRNIALSAPYMHNGRLATLPDVIDFYAQGGGRADGVANVDNQILGFTLTEQERADLIAFLDALTDESALPAVPAQVPSGLPVISRLDNPARAEVAAANVALSAAGEAPAHTPQTLRVTAGETIQAVVDRAGPGDTIEVPHGTYPERVVIDQSDITLLGLPNANGEWPVLDGRGQLADGVIASGNGFEMAYFHVRNYTSNGVLVEGVRDVHLHDLFAEDTGVYGIYPTRSSGVLVERVEATGNNDAGIYAGKCEDVIIRDSVAYGNVIGIEVENTVGAEIYDNHVYDNSLGLFIDLLPQLPSKVSLNTRVYNNLSENNNFANFAPPGATASLVRTGTGLLILAADRVEAYDNIVRGNRSAGIAVFNLAIGFAPDEIDVGPNPEYTRIHSNTLENNGYDADPFIRDMLGSGFDIIWDGSGRDNRFDQPGASSFPPVLPGASWPEPVYNLYWRVVNFVVGLLG